MRLMFLLVMNKGLQYVITQKQLAQIKVTGDEAVHTELTLRPPANERARFTPTFVFYLD